MSNRIQGLLFVIALSLLQGCSFLPSSLFFSLKPVLEDTPGNLVPIAIIGSGPAGLSAAIYGARGGVRTVVFTGSKPGGLLTETTAVENWPGIAIEQGPVIMKKLQEQAESFGAHIAYETVDAVNFKRWPFVLHLGDGSKVEALTVILAMGASPRRLGILGEQAYWGKGVTACAVCDAPFFKGEEVVVVGGGDSAVEEAMQLAKYAKKVTILVRKGAMRAAQSMQKLLAEYQNIHVLYNVEIAEVLGDGERVTGVLLFHRKDESLSSFATNGVFLAIGHIPNSELVKPWVSTDRNGYIEVYSPSQRSSVAGVFAAGDIEDYHYRQAGVASGRGIKAAMDALLHLTDMGYNTAVEERLKPFFFTAKSEQSLDLLHVTSKKDLKDILNSDPIVVVDFYSTSCPPCMQMLPIISSIASVYTERGVAFVKVNIDDQNELVKQYNILKVPTLLVFKRGKLIEQINTAMNRQEIEALIDPLLLEG